MVCQRPTLCAGASIFVCDLCTSAFQETGLFVSCILKKMYRARETLTHTSSDALHRFISSKFVSL